MDIKGFLDRFEACYVNNVRFVNQNDVEFLIEQLQLENKKDPSDLERLIDISDKLNIDSYYRIMYQEFRDKMTPENIKKINNLISNLYNFIKE